MAPAKKIKTWYYLLIHLCYICASKSTRLVINHKSVSRLLQRDRAEQILADSCESADKVFGFVMATCFFLWWPSIMSFYSGCTSLERQNRKVRQRRFIFFCVFICLIAPSTRADHAHFTLAENNYTIHSKETNMIKWKKENSTRTCQENNGTAVNGKQSGAHLYSVPTKSSHLTGNNVTITITSFYT